MNRPTGRRAPTPRATLSARDLFRLTFGRAVWHWRSAGRHRIPATRAATQDLSFRKSASSSRPATSPRVAAGSSPPSSRPAPDDGGGLRPHREPRFARASKAFPCSRRTPLRTGSLRPATGRRAATTGRTSPGRMRLRGCAEGSEDARRALDCHREGGCAELFVDLAAGDRIESAPRFVPQEVGHAHVPVNRTDAMGFMGGAQNTNEECYLFQKAARLLGMAYVEHQARL